MVVFVTDFINTIQKKVAKKSISCTIRLEKDMQANDCTDVGYTFDVNILPQSVRLFYSYVHYINIYAPKHFELLSLQQMYCIDHRYIVFSKMDKINLIAFDIGNYNRIDDEFDIVSVHDKYIITKTFSSFITNKVWAWVNRGRVIWKQEFFEAN